VQGRAREGRGTHKQCDGGSRHDGQPLAAESSAGATLLLSVGVGVGVGGRVAVRLGLGVGVIGVGLAGLARVIRLCFRGFGFGGVFDLGNLGGLGLVFAGLVGQITCCRLLIFH